MIKRNGYKYHVEIFNPKHMWKYLGRIIILQDNTKVFCTHMKKPNKHFYIKGKGYPINVELLMLLHNARIKYIMIPEDGKRDFKAYMAETNAYLNGFDIAEPLTERQKYIPLSECTEIPVNKEQLKNVIYGG